MNRMTSPLYQRWTFCMIITVYINWAQAGKHMILHMGSSIDKIYTTDGATILSTYNQTDAVRVQWIMLVPPSPKQRFLIQFEHMDIPCPQKLTITEADISRGLMSSAPEDTILDHFCGGMNDLFAVNRFETTDHSIRTSEKGNGLHIMWVGSDKMSVPQQGLRLLVTAFTQTADCTPDSFMCRRMCINSDLICDGFTHCLDKSDESLNCTPALRKSVGSVPMCLPSPCGESSLQWRFHHNTLTLMIPMVLALIFLSVAILWRNKRILRRLIQDNRPTQRSAISFDSSEIATAEHETFYNAEIPEVCGGDPPNFDPDWGIQLPPPYSAMDDMQFVPPIQGVDQPPPYDAIVQEREPLCEATSSKTQSAPPVDIPDDTG